MSVPPIRIATRSSRLALCQAEFVADLLRTVKPDRSVELVHVSTLGDRDQTEPLDRLAGFGVFTREVQKAVLENQADLAVHSLKDLPTEPVPGLTLAGVPERGPAFDVLVLPESHHSEVDPQNPLEILPTNAAVGSGSLRRQAQLRHHRGDLNVTNVRGNVETRLRKLDEGRFDALVLAEAGLRRLSLDERISAILGPPLLLPAVGQGALGIECRSDDNATKSLLASLTHPPTHAAVRAERRLLAELRAGCRAPLGAFTHLENGMGGVELTLEAVVLSPDGRQRITARVTGPLKDPESLGIQAAESLKQQGADKLVAAARDSAP